MHKILERQLRKFSPGYPNISPELAPLIEVVSKTYEDFDNDRVQLERSTEISSRELEEGNRRLAESSHLLQSTIDAVEDAIFVTSMDYRFIAHNRRYREMWNISEITGETDGKQIVELVAAQLLTPVDFAKSIREINADTEHKSRDVLTCRDGRIIDRQSFPMSIDGSAVARVWVLRDITELENAKKATINLLEDLEHEKHAVEEKVQERTKELSEEHARFVASTSSIPLGFLVFDTANKILINNNAVRTVFHIEKAEYTLEDIDRAIPGVRLAEKFTRCLEEHLPIEVKDVDVVNRILRILITPMSAGDGSKELLGVVVLIEDTTEARTLERGRDEFFAIASHELRTPLTAIRGNMSIIEDYYKETITDKEVLEMIKDTNNAASRLITIVNDFLDVSRLEQGHITFQLSNFSPQELAEEVIGELRELALKKGIALSSECKVKDILVRADRDRSKQILMNLASNAINYSERGTVAICVSLSDTHVEFSVRDQGVGISPQNQTLLFRKFQQAGVSVLARDMTQSTGLGLYISRLIVEPMGGKIWLKKSAPGEGSEFAFTLPLAPLV